MVRTPISKLYSISASVSSFLPARLLIWHRALSGAQTPIRGKERDDGSEEDGFTQRPVEFCRRAASDESRARSEFRRDVRRLLCRASIVSLN